MTDITPIVTIFITLLSALASCVILPLARSKFDAQELRNALLWIDIAVEAAEQLYNQNDGKKKKQYVLNFLTSKGITLNEHELDTAIEAAVLELHKEIAHD